MEFPDLFGERLDLVEISDAGLNDLHEYSVMPEFYKYMEFGVHQDLDDTKKYLQKLISRSSQPTGHYWYIQLKSSKKYIGTFGVLDIDFRKGMAEIGYGLSPLFWGKGYFKECLGLVLTYLFVERGFHKIWAKTQADNLPSITALEKTGFRQEGRLRDFYLSMKDGKRADAVVMGLLRMDLPKNVSSNCRF